MTYDEAKQSYLEWLCGLVGVGGEYSILMWHLFECRFETDCLLPLDVNRALDGENLRWRWSGDCDVPQYIVMEYIDDGPCTILEMMVALAIRMEDDIMYDPEYGNRTALWFGDMIRSLELDQMTDENFDAEYVGYCINRLLTRTYDPDGKGGLFTLENPVGDCRKAEIWYQMNWYLGEHR